MIKQFSRYSYRFSTQKAQETLYQVLHVSPTASQEQISNAYAELIKQQNQTSLDVQNQSKIREAYEVLSNPEKRKVYDYGFQVQNKPQNEAKVERTNDSLFIQIFIAFMVGGLVQVWNAYNQENQKEQAQLKASQQESNNQQTL